MTPPITVTTATTAGFRQRNRVCRDALFLSDVFRIFPLQKKVNRTTGKKVAV
ncbi:hypothetical protein [Paraburkholderia adhaesiva]|uniref:hypothetical protein n=1 Tax=Paraburkholderia adhaesiva TaxID=2883244 RepID=UPI001F1A0E90|nr:hypothetical protein [Paraburkholderia adhaesiva]